MTQRLLMASAFTLCSLAVSLPCASQSRPPAQDPVRQLQSSDPLQRASAFWALRSKPGALTAPNMASVLLDALERENGLILSTLRESKGRTGVSVKYGESFAEYYAELLGACHKYCDRNNSKVIEVIANGAYNTGDPLATELAEKHGEGILPLMLQKTHSDLWGRRHDALVMLQKIETSNRSLSTQNRSLIHEAVRERATDESEGVRREAVRTLGVIGGVSDVALLNGVAERDADFRVREEAHKAIAKIRRQRP